MVSSVRQRLRSAPICVPFEFEWQGDDYVVDHVDVLDGGEIVKHPEPIVIVTKQGGSVIASSYGVRVAQPVEIAAVSLAALESAGAQAVPDAALLKQTITLFLAVGAHVDNGQVVLSIGLAEVDLGPIIGSLPDANQIEGAIVGAAQQFGEVETLLDMGPLTTLVGYQIPASNVGVGTDDAGTVVFVRVELGGPFNSSIPDWSSFYQTEQPNHLAGHDWCQLIDKQAVVQAVSSRIESALDAAEQNDTFVAPGNPSNSWHPAWPGVGTSFWGEVVDACPVWIGFVYIGLIDVGLDVTMETHFSVPENNTLAMNIKFYWNVNDVEAVACAISAGTFWPAAGTILMADGKINGEFSAGMIFGPFVVFSAFLIGLDVAAAPPDLEIDAFEKVDSTDADLEYVQRTENIDLGPLIDLTAVYGVPSALVVAGTMASFEIAHPPKLTAVVGDSFDWRWHDLCQSYAKLHADASASFIHLAGSGAHTPLAICDARVVDDEYDQFSPYLTVTPSLEGGTIQVSVPVDGVVADYVANPYPCKVLVTTNGGARLISFPPLKTLSAEEIAALNQTRLIMKVVYCTEWAHFFWGKHYNPKWDIDPPEEAVKATKLAQVGVAAGTSVGRIVLEGEQRRVLAVADVRPRSVVHISALLPADSDFTVRGEPSQETRDEETTAGRITVHEALLAKATTCRFSDAVTTVSLGRVGQHRAMFCTAGGDLWAIDIRVLTSPRIISRLRGLSLDGFLPTAEGGVGCGSEGLVLVKAGARPGLSDAEVISRARARSLVRYRGLIYALSDESLSIHDLSLEQIGQVDLPGCETMLVVGDELVVAGHRVVTRLALSDPSRPASRFSYALPEDGDLWDTRSRSKAGLLIHVAGVTGAGRTWELADNGKATPVAEYLGQPWFVGLARGGRTFARILSDRRTVELYQLIRGKQLNQEEIEARPAPEMAVEA